MGLYELGRFFVKVQFRDWNETRIFGGFCNQERAEQCVVVLASRQDVLSATIQFPPDESK